MKIVMFSNTYLPMVGGIERSIATFCEDFTKRGHFCRIVTPEIEGEDAERQGVLPVPAITGIGEKDFSWAMPPTSQVRGWIESIKPDIIHGHHPFLLGDTALRVARRWERPLVFTHHTLYERYARYFLRESEATRRFAVALSKEYANLCDCVVAPTESIRALLRERGLTSRIEVIPTGIELGAFAGGDREGLRADFGLPREGWVFGHLGRLTEEKNISFLARAVLRALENGVDGYFLLVGDGDALAEVQALFAEAGQSGRLICPGMVKGRRLADAYAAMDLFLFASMTDTQGIVLAEAMAAGVPVVALDAPGARDTIEDGLSGRLIATGEAAEADFAEALRELSGDAAQWRQLSEGARERAKRFERGRCAEEMLALYEDLCAAYPSGLEARTVSRWEDFMARWESEWDLFLKNVRAVKALLE